ncbi:hypothetical protein OAT16_11290, partial [Prolixibacteraceae bacterium]|nr:hypothetical protein [Prolixibacteraceae bacterium]
PMDLLIKRLIHNSSQRPIVKGKSEDELYLFVHDALKKREPFYLRSNIVCLSDDTLSTSKLMDLMGCFIDK